MRKLLSIPVLFGVVLFGTEAIAQGSISVRMRPVNGNVQMLDCVGDFGGGNVTASIGPDGILICDNMFKATTPLVLAELKKAGGGNIRYVIDSHFHRDHIEGNSVLSGSSTI